MKTLRFSSWTNSFQFPNQNLCRVMLPCTIQMLFTCHGYSLYSVSLPPTTFLPNLFTFPQEKPASKLSTLLKRTNHVMNIMVASEIHILNLSKDLSQKKMLFMELCALEILRITGENVTSLCLGQTMAT